MNYNIQDFCLICLSTSNEKFTAETSTYSDNMTPFDKIKNVFLGLSAVMDNDSRICLKCCDKVDSIYEFHKTCLKNVNILNSYKIILKENKSKNQCELFVNLNVSQQCKDITLSSEEVRIEPPQNNEGSLCDTDQVLESHSRGVVVVKKEIEMNFKSCDKELENFSQDSEMKIKIEDFGVEKVWINEMNENSVRESLQPNSEHFESVPVPLTQEVIIKEEVNAELDKDRLLEFPDEKSDNGQENCESFKTNQSKSFEVKPIHQNNEEFDFIDCGKTVNCKLDSNNQILSDSKGNTDEKLLHKCYFCGKLFKRTSFFKSHILIHTGEKSYKCDICETSFHQPGKLKLHMLSHTGEKPHKCDICGKLFRLKGDLKRHYLIHTGEKPYKCDICQDLFKQKYHLQSHMLMHTGEKSHKCNICGKLFSHKPHLNRHFVIHTGEKPHQCDICGKLFNRPGNLKLHMSIHTNEKPHRCDS